MMFRVAFLSAVANAYDDESMLLSTVKAAVQNDMSLDAEQSLEVMKNQCVAAFGGHDDLTDGDEGWKQIVIGQCDVCTEKATATAVAAGHHASLLSGEYLTEIITCMDALPGDLHWVIADCQDIFGASAKECKHGGAQCFASHQSETCNIQHLEGCLDDPGFMACIAHRFEYTKCHDNVNGVGHCMVCSHDCLHSPPNIPNKELLESAEFKTCIAGCFEPQTEAEGDAGSLCTNYYPNNLHKCIGCAIMSKGDTQCTGSHCLALPAFVQDQITCMWESSNEDGCDSVVPAPYQGAEEVCQAAYGHLEGGTKKCIQAGAHCLALHPCSCITSCSEHNGWFNCFAHEMEFTECNDHPSGVAKCMTCGAKCLMQEQCGTPEECMSNANFISCHRGCASCATSLDG